MMKTKRFVKHHFLLNLISIQGSSCRIVTLTKIQLLESIREVKNLHQ